MATAAAGGNLLQVPEGTLPKSRCIFTVFHSQIRCFTKKLFQCNHHVMFVYEVGLMMMQGVQRHRIKQAFQTYCQKNTYSAKGRKRLLFL